MNGSVLGGMKSDALREIYNISMGAAATAVSGMLGETVTILNPEIIECSAGAPVGAGDIKFEGNKNIYVKFDYTSGAKGTCVFVLSFYDMQIIVNGLMGTPAEPDVNYDFDDMKLSAVTEVMNQLLGAATTSMSQFLNTPVEITAPQTTVSDNKEEIAALLGVSAGETVCEVSLDFKAGDFINNKMLAFMPVGLASGMAVQLMGEDPMEEPAHPSGQEIISGVKIDAIGEIQNIMMGSAATALSNFMSAKVWITTPVVEVIKAGGYDFADLDPSICVKINYVVGIHGASFMVLRQSDVQLMVNQLMGMPLEVTDDFEFNELNISAVCEIMNQMMGASATTLSEIIKTPTDISTPEAVVINKVDDILKINNITSDDDVCAISFDLTIDNVIQSKFVTMLTIDLANEMADKMLASYSSDLDEYGGAAGPAQPAPAPAAAAPAPAQPAPAPAPAPVQSAPAPAAAPAPAPRPQPQPKTIGGGSSSRAYNYNNYDDDYDEGVDGRSFLTDKQYDNLKSLLDVPMEVTVRIGSTSKSIDEVGNFTRGTVIELDSLANEPVDIMVNGNLIAKGDVVVVDDNFAVRITEIVKAKG